MNLIIKPKPFIKWAGGKQIIADALIDYFPSEFDKYYEPFIGGGSVLFKLNPCRGIINDQNEWLINTYKAIQADWRKVSEILDFLPNTKEEFLNIRSIPHETLDIFSQGAHFIYLNKTCFRGLFRVNKKGQFNVPYGDYDRRYYDPDVLKNVSDFLQNMEIRSTDFEIALFDVKQDDFIYFDPPYYKSGEYSDFNRYTPNQFKEKEHIRLASLCRELDNRGVRWALSNSDTEFVNFLYEGFNINKIENRREINLNSKKRSVKELLITNYNC